MNLNALIPGTAVVLALLAATARAGPEIRSHDLQLTLDPSSGRLDGTDTVAVARDGGGKLRFSLNAALTISEALVDGRKALGLEKVEDDGWRAEWQIDVPAGPGAMGAMRLRYSGRIQDDVEKSETLGFVVGDSCRGVVFDQGVYLSGGSYYYPDDGGVARFDVRVSIPAPYLAISQGTLVERTSVGTSDVSRWRGKVTADSLAVVAGRLKYFERKGKRVTVGAYLSDANAAGAEILLDAAEREIATYSELLGAYAFDRFDVVENFFSSGYGFPEFTLLGQHVVARMVMESQRSGRIPPGYLDHEIVHCWWGNLVYPDYDAGNWCEGLTSYCSNYLAKERESPAAARTHRERSSVRFSTRVTADRDYPVRSFTGKVEDFDNEIGYTKCSMTFHMLRREIGDKAFWSTLRRVTKDHAGKRVSWAVWQAEFEKTSGRNLGEFFAQWLDRTGAPLLGLGDTRVESKDGRTRVIGTIQQHLAPDEKPWKLTVPLVVELLDGQEEFEVVLNGASADFSVLVPSLPLAVHVDPEHHVFRRLAPAEIPACLSATLERPHTMVVYPDDDSALRAVAERARSKGATVISASEAPKTVPKGVSLLILGDTERVPLLAALRAPLKSHFPGRGDGEDVTILATSRSPADRNEFVTTFVGTPEALAGRARAIFYYQFDGRIVFAGRRPRERETVPGVSLTRKRVLPDVRADPLRVERHLKALTAKDIEGRLAGTAAEKAARRIVATALREAGLAVSEQKFSFKVRRTHAESELLVGGERVADAHPLVASPTTEPDGVTAAGFASDPSDDLTGLALVVDVPAQSDDPLGFVRGVAELAKAGGAVAVLVRVPEEGAARVAELYETPEALHPAVRARLDATKARGGSGDHLMRAAGTAARNGYRVDLPLPAFAVPADTALDGTLTLIVKWNEVVIESANVVGRLQGGGGRGRAILLGAHVDHLGTGFPGADDDASGLAALIEAANVLAAHQDRLSRDVLFVAFGAEEWGLRGSRHYMNSLNADYPVEPRVSVALTADTIGHAAVTDVSIVGISKHPRLARVVAAALEQSSFTVGKDIDRFAFAHGSDHYSFHEQGVPAVDLWSGDYQVMHTKRDTLDIVDPKKIARIGRAMALAALALSNSY